MANRANLLGLGAWCLGGMTLVVGLAGCGSGGADQAAARPSPPAAARSAPPPSPAQRPARSPARPTPAPQPPRATGQADPPPRTSLEDLMQAPEAADPAARRENLPFIKRTIDERRAAAAGIRKIEGKHLTLYTDLAPSPEVDELPRIFDLAVPQWCDYFGVAPAKVAGWKLNGYLMDRKERFQASGLMPDDLPEFPFGYQRDWEFWLYEQPSAYYRRHLLLHEGTHGFMFHQLGGGGPAWYSEGLAELLGTHRWANGQLTLRYFPQSREETPEWGRIKIIRDAYARNAGLPIDQILEYSDTAHRQTPPYAWSWALCAFLDGHPQFQRPFRAMFAQVTDRTLGFNDKFKRQLAAEEWIGLNEQWQLFVVNLDYGYDVARSAIAFQRGAPLPAGGATVAVAADRGWQAAGVKLEAGKTYRLAASGQFVVGRSTKPWPCEANGITLRYHQGRPLGILLAAVRDDDNPLLGYDLSKPLVVGLGGEITPPHSGTLYLCINESPAGLADNSGQLSVRIDEP